MVEERFAADRESLARWAEQWRGRLVAVAIEATTGWRWVWRELVAGGFEVRLAEPVQTRALLGRRRSAKTDRLDARWLARLLAKEMLPQSWIPPAQIQELRDRTRLRKALAEDRRRWGQRLHACLLHEGWPCSKSNLLRPPGLRGPVVEESGESRRRGHLAKAGSPHLRWALVEAAVHAHRTTAPDLALYRATRARRDTSVARLTVARKIGKRAFHALRELELATT